MVPGENGVVKKRLRLRVSLCFRRIRPSG